MIKTQSLQDIWKKVYTAFDERVRAITAGLDLEELRAVLRGDPPTERPNPRYKVHTTSFIFHIRPRYYEKGSTIFTHTFRLGFFTAFFFFIELFTGLILMIYYTPSPDAAYTSILNLESNVPFGKMLRDMHRLGAEGMVIFTALHMLRTYLTGSYKKERTFTWLTGVALLGITLLLSFSGYLLPWDQLSYWAVTIGTSMADAIPLIGREANLLLRGAPDIGAGGLLRFYLIHVVLFPLAAILVLSIHYYKVGREHGISLPASIEEGNAPPNVKREAKQRIDYIPDLLTHEVFLTSLGILLTVLGLTVFGYAAPLEHVANPQQTPLDTKAPWYFWWLQGMLKLGDKTLMGIVLPGIMTTLLILVPYIDRNPHRLMTKRPFAVAIGIMSVLVLVTLSYMGTPAYGIESPAATRIVQDLVPEEGEGLLRTIPFDQLRPGIYEVNVTKPVGMCSDQDFGCPELESFFQHYTDLVNKKATAESNRFKDPKATLKIENWQQDLKKITLHIDYLDRTGKAQFYERDLYLHRFRGGE